MRCPKCGFISFDYLTSCEKCGRDLGEIVSALGLGVIDSADFSWFHFNDQEAGDSTVLDTASEASVSHEEGPSLDLGDIDVSDLISDEYDADALEEIEEVAIIDDEVIETVAVDQEFQQALDEVIAE